MTATELELSQPAAGGGFGREEEGGDEGEGASLREKTKEREPELPTREWGVEDGRGGGGK
jgi:hypothetical protein